jgi:SPP1 gp7 family putative phage head morphogenesis protein
MDELATPQEMAKMIKKAIAEVGEFRKGHSKTIARTEIGSITEQTRFDAFKEEGIERWEWVSAMDEKVRDTHVLENGEVRKVGDTFPHTGLRYPLDPAGDPSEVINCFPEDTLTYCDDVEAMYKSLYKGELITIKTASGHKLTGTANHPILTDRGFIPLRFLKKGDRVVSCDWFEWESFCNSDIQNAPTYIKKSFNSFSVKNVIVRESACNVNFYGDLPQGDVDIIDIGGKLFDGGTSTRNKPFKKPVFSFTNFTERSLFSDSILSHCIDKERFGFSSDDFMGGSGQPASFFGRRLAHSKKHRIAPASRSDVIFNEPFSDNIPFDSIFGSDSKFRHSADIVRHNTGRINGKPCSSLNNASAFKTMMNSSNMDTVNRGDISCAFPVAIQFDDIVDVTIKNNFCGHVYTFQANKGIYIASGIIARNCRCVNVATEREET